MIAKKKKILGSAAQHTVLLALPHHHAPTLLIVFRKHCTGLRTFHMMNCARHNDTDARLSPTPHACARGSSLQTFRTFLILGQRHWVQLCFHRDESNMKQTRQKTGRKAWSGDGEGLLCRVTRMCECVWWGQVRACVCVSG